MSKKPTIAIDVDEVLAQFVAALSIFHNEQFGTSLSAASFHSYRFSEVWGGTDDEATVKIHDFFASDHFKNIEPVPGALEALQELQLHFDLVVITSRQFSIAEETRRWIGVHFPNIFSEIVFGNHWGLSGIKRSKAELCVELGARLLVDDLVDYAHQCSAVVDRVIIFGEYAWNRAPGPANARRAADWPAARALIEEQLLCPLVQVVPAASGTPTSIVSPNP